MAIAKILRLCLEADKEGLEVLTSPSAVTELLNSKKASAANKYDNSYTQNVGALIEEAKADDTSSMDTEPTPSDTPEEPSTNTEELASDDSTSENTEDKSSDKDTKDEVKDDEEDGPVKKPNTVKDDGKDKEEKDSKDKESKPPIDDVKTAQENLRINIVPEMWTPYFSVALEGVDHSEYTDRQFVNAGQDVPIDAIVNWTGEKLKDFYHWAKDVGVEYGPGVLDKVSKGLAGLTKGIAKGLISITEVTRRYLSRRNDSFKKIDKEIAYLRSKLENLKDAKPQGTYTDNKNISLLKRGKSVDVSANLALMTKFTEFTIKGLATVLKQDYELISHLMNMDSVSNVHDVSGIMTMKNLNTILNKGDMKGYEVKSELLQGYTSKYAAMGDVRVCAHIPKEDLSKLSEDPKEVFKHYRSAFEKSSMFLGMDMAGTAPAAGIQFVGTEGLIKIINNLEAFVTKCKEHTSFYEETDRELGSFKTKWKVFLSSLVNSKKNLTIEETHMEIVQLRFGFIQKNYLPLAIDVDEYTFKIMHATISFSEANIKALQ